MDEYPVELLETSTTLSTGMLYVNVDLNDLFQHFDHNEAELFLFLGKLKDLLG